MDFEGLFWIALIIFYFVTRVVGGKKRSKPSPRPTGQPRPTPEQPRTGTSPGEPEGELDEALREIRRALGFPVEEQETASQAPAESGSTVPPNREDSPLKERRRTAELEDRRQSRRASELEKRRQTDAREAARQRELLERADAASSRKRSRIPEPKVSRLPGPVGAHPMESSFKEEEIFERRGRHPHRESTDRSAPGSHRGTQRSRAKERLRGRSSLREAFVLKEVLDKPLSMRGRR